MKTKTLRNAWIALSLILAAAVCFAEDAKQSEVYTGVVTNIPGRVSTLSMKMYISSYTSDEELVQLATLLKEKGPDALLKAIGKIDRGRMAPTGRIGSDVGLIRSRPTETGQRITMVMERPQAFAEMWSNSRSTDYPFGILVMDLDKDGKGQGTLMVAAKIEVTDQNVIEIENYGSQPHNVISITKLK